ncbi:phosphotransferase [Bacillus sp. B15-48]|uniref:phosphotransferase n=1 Tax=Bacillus sp. B15-48 TaxID=1548601 RepID=UPI00193EE96D|nr:phosphotransferase [Bacillus sp. B15-48]
MKINLYSRRDDFIDRLFSFLSCKLPVSIKQITKIREHVFFIATDVFPFILKGYHDLRKLILHQNLTAALKKQGFVETYTFYHFTNQPLLFENVYYGCIEYLDVKKPPFTFRSYDERMEGIQLLSKFHSFSANLVEDFSPFLQKQDLLTKWQVRYHRFKTNQPIVNKFVEPTITAELLEWGERSLAGMKQYHSSFELNKLVILHGDVAHHNFIKDNTEKLYLIDFDLVSIGPKEFDLLQYANRILPFMDWSLEEFMDINALSSFIHQKGGFLYGLMYPADFYREWNRLISQNLFHDSNLLASLYEITVNQFPKRKRFLENIRTVAEK